MPDKSYPAGTAVKLTITVKNGSGVATDPALLKVRHSGPTLTWTEKAYPADVEVVRESAGNFYMVVYTPSAVASEGRWDYESEAVDGSGNIIGTGEGRFNVHLTARLRESLLG